MARAATTDAVVLAIVNEGTAAVLADVVNVGVRLGIDAGADLVQTGRIRAGTPLHWQMIDPGTDDALTEALQTGRARFYGDPDAYRARFERGGTLLHAYSVEAVAAHPLYGSDGIVVGAIAFAYENPQPFDASQRVLINTVADIAAQSLDRAQLYDRERDVARALQMALLPAALPDLDDIATEARYVAGGAGVSVGGDWYDVLRFADGRVGLVIGDAAGRGVEAAALMGKVRHAAAALAMDHESPATVLSRVNEYLHTISSRSSMLTCCYMVLDRDRGIVRYASAGHPPPLVIEADGEPHFLGGGRGMPLGVLATAVYTDAEHRLRCPATIVLYTDGLVERRGESIDVGLARLVDAVGDARGDIADLCDHLTSKLLSDTSDDDVALLAARVSTLPSATKIDLRLPADSRRLHELRTRAGRWMRSAGIDPAVISDMIIALNEAASNSMLHAYSGASPRGHVRISISIDANQVAATVSDEGRWRDPADGHDGRGLDLMQKLMTDVRVERDDNGTRVLLTRAVSH
jgi:serine phosphatase RsbU (regulator of sigma subunit)/anti-sigma regulatory factor (Ser/Thr protein kinase)